MRVMAPKPFMFEAGERAVLLLHGFTGNSSDVRMMGRYLQDKGYTCYAPIYKGHGVPPEELVMSGPRDWWKDVLMGYDALKRRGHDEIAVAGLSLGGVFSLKLGYTLPLKGIITMCAPMSFKSIDEMNEGVMRYAREYKKREGKEMQQIERELALLEPTQTLNALQELIKSVRESLHTISVPAFVVQSKHDQIIDPESAEIIYNEIRESNKQLKWYEKSGHVITLDKEKEQLHQDVYRFLEQLNWKE